MHNLVYLFKDGIGTGGHFTLTLRMPKMVFALVPKDEVKDCDEICNVNHYKVHGNEDEVLAVERNGI